MIKRSEDMDRTQGKEGGIHGCIWPTPLLHFTWRGNEFQLTNRTFLVRSWFHFGSLKTLSVSAGIFYQCAMDLTLSLRKWDRLQTYSPVNWVLLMKMPDGNFFNWLLLNHLPKVIERGVDYIVLVNLVRALSLVEKVVFCFKMLTKSYCPRTDVFFAGLHIEKWASITNYNLAQI